MSNTLWIEKYRPVKFDDVIADKNIIKEINLIIKNKDIPNMIFTGTPGIGKTTTILCIAKQLYGKYFKDTVLELNASDDRGIKTINSGAIGNFCSFKLPYTDEDKNKYCKHKLIILDESDNMTEKVLPIISMLMDTHYKTTRFVFTCNSSSKIIESIQTRCKIIRFTRLSIEMVSDRLERILKLENVKYDKKILNEIALISDGDMRYGINFLQLLVDRFGLVNKDNFNKIYENPSNDILYNILNLISKSNIKSALIDIHKLKNSGFSVYDIFTGYFNYFKSINNTINEDLKIQLMIILSGYLFTTSKYNDTDINLTNFILDIYPVLNNKSLKS
jgi:replication factor C subunit 2/4